MSLSFTHSARADLVDSLHAPWAGTVGECLDRWAALGTSERARSYLVLRGEAGARRTLNATAIAALAEVDEWTPEEVTPFR